ncbi:ribosome hibernation-promoting factor, HPF/YfiA family [Sanguibacter sp. A247]|uniref:ribosome hibernation-promoting factor, HPF/YfiA family n=1 Tax=unclassified Sanguibacter TaxID=2645534 RepID=UPI003FD6D0A7
MEIAIVGRHTEVPERFRRHVEEKLSKVSQLAPRAQRIEVEVTEEKNPRLADVRERVELTVRDKGPVVRAEAAADDRYAALDLATAKLFERLRRVRDRRKDHRGNMIVEPVDVRPYTEPPAEPEAPTGPLSVGETAESTLGDSPVLIRQKVHAGRPMTIDEALYEMELVGHDFYLFVNSETGRPSAVYNRRGWSYGVIELDVS